MYREVRYKNLPNGSQFKIRSLEEAIFRKIDADWFETYDWPHNDKGHRWPIDCNGGKEEFMFLVYPLRRHRARKKAQVRRLATP